MSPFYRGQSSRLRQPEKLIASTFQFKKLIDFLKGAKFIKFKKRGKA